MAKKLTNVTLIKGIMETDMVMQVFVLTAVQVYAQQIIAGELPMPTMFITPDEWIKTAEDIEAQITAHLKS